MLSSKPNVIVYFRRNNLIIAGKHITPAKLALPADVLNNLEVKDAEKFLALAKAFFLSHDIRGKRALVVLDDSIVFHKTVELEESKKNAGSTPAAAYEAVIPFEPGRRACLQVREDNTLDLYATNADLYGVLQEALKTSGIRKVIAITPVAAFKLESSTKPPQAIERYTNDASAHRSADFSTITPF